MAPIWLGNLKQWVTGTLNGSKYSLDVNIANTAAISVATSDPTWKEFRWQDAADTLIPKKTGTAVQIGDSLYAAAVLANTITVMKVASNVGKALAFYSGANSGALTLIGTVAAGQTSEARFGVSLIAGDKVWVRALQDADVTVGELLVNFFG